jgi:hypothetical protein
MLKAAGPIAKPKIGRRALRATSAPERSSRGSGSVKPAARAAATAAENGVSVQTVLKM